MTSPGIEIHNLTKAYPFGHIIRRRRTALVDLSLSVTSGEIFGYLGPNGSGKTTTLKLLMGLVRPDSGTATILGYPIESLEWRRRAGYLPEHPYLYDYLTVEEYLDFVGRLFGMDRAARRRRAGELLDRVGLAAAAKVPLRRCSKGMIQRAGLAQALMNDPEIVFLDEPMSGLDPVGRRLVRDIILDLRRAGRTVFFSTHILSDAETLCDRIALLSGGRLVKTGRLDEILKVDVSHMEVLVSGVRAEDLAASAGLRVKETLGERLRIEVEESALGALIRDVEIAKGRVLSVQPVRQSLEEYFFKELANADPRGAWQLEA
jgi:ABC-2 type transport system ATP-binding protein